MGGARQRFLLLKKWGRICGKNAGVPFVEIGKKNGPGAAQRKKTVFSVLSGRGNLGTDLKKGEGVKGKGGGGGARAITSTIRGERVKNTT